MKNNRQKQQQWCFSAPGIICYGNTAELNSDIFTQSVTLSFPFTGLLIIRYHRCQNTHTHTNLNRKSRENCSSSLSSVYSWKWKVVSNLWGDACQFPGVHKLVHLLEDSDWVTDRQKALETAKRQRWSSQCDCSWSITKRYRSSHRHLSPGSAEPFYWHRGRVGEFQGQRPADWTAQSD